MVSKFVNSHSHVAHRRLMPPPRHHCRPPADYLWEQVGRPQHGKQLHHDDWWDWLSDHSTGGCREGERLCIPQVCRKIGAEVRAWLDILAGNLVWIQGPYPAGKYNNIKIFNSVLRHYLEPGERVEADNGYVGHADKIKCLHNTCNPEENLAIQACVRSWHETWNGRLKNWGILAQVYSHDIVAHGMVFHACTVVSQLSIANGEPLFEVEYGD